MSILRSILCRRMSPLATISPWLYTSMYLAKHGMYVRRRGSERRWTMEAPNLMIDEIEK